jgi:hypothetical protein
MGRVDWPPFVGLLTRMAVDQIGPAVPSVGGVTLQA